MVISGFFVWWYGSGLVQSYQVVLAILEKITDFFSVELLLKTLWAPWKNDVLTAPNAALGDQIKIWEQNLASRIVGFMVRLIVILVGLLIIAIFSGLALLMLLLHLALPLIILALPIYGVGLFF